MVDVSKIEIRDNKYVGKIKLPPKAIPNPKEEEAFLQAFGGKLPYYLLKYGDDIIEKIRQYAPLPPTIDVILKYTAKGIKLVSKRLSIG